MNRVLPKRKIPIFNSRYVGTDQGKHGEENQDHARGDVSSEFTQETVIACSHNLIFEKTGAKISHFAFNYSERSIFIQQVVEFSAILPL